MRNLAALIVVAAIALSASVAFAWPATTLKVQPYGVDYPLISPMSYPSSKGDPYERRFGVRRWMNPFRPNEFTDADRTLDESYRWFQLYGGYGVIGHGEDVFTRKAAHFRKTHRGR
ncbi:MAG: hypothetical protein HY913_19910 [Desulfomonile tiedjei]|nr:hypothetical protein [Desulfomonile tiedjei]